MRLLTIAYFISLLSASASAATMSASLTAPTIDGADIANYGLVTGTDKWWCDGETSGRPKGQTFTTGDRALYLNALTYQVAETSRTEPTKEYVIRVGTIDRVDPAEPATWVFSEIYREEATQDFAWNEGEYMTWTLDEPLLLSPLAEYGIDVGMTSSTTGWQTGIPYIHRTADEYPDGTRYMSGVAGVGVGDTTMNNVGGDMLFHLDLNIADLPCPFGLTASGGPAGVTLQWRNGLELPTSVQVLRNAQEIASAAPVDPPTFTDTTALPGLLDYELVFTMPGDPCESLTTAFDGCIGDLAATRSEGGVVLTWSNHVVYEGIEVRRDGEPLEVSLDGTVETYTDEAPPFDVVVTYTVVPTSGTCEPASVEVDMSYVRNSGFEDPVLADGEWVVGGTDWSTGYYDIAADPELWIAGWDDAGVWNPDAADGFTEGAYAGENTGWAISSAGADAGLSQVLDIVLEPDTEYTLGVQVGNAFYNGSDETASFRLELLAGGVLLDWESGESPLQDSWEEHTLTYQSADDPDLVGEPLEIRLIAEAYTDGGGADGYEVDFDEVTLTISGGPGGATFVRGDANSDGSINLTDGIVILNFLFLGQPPPVCLDAADVDDDGGNRPSLTDAIRVFNWLFTGGPPPAEPEPGGANYVAAECGIDPTEDDGMDCATPAAKCE